ncbi:MAG: hypothetical protein AAF288_10425 [Planctomycetota bacterium]
MTRSGLQPDDCPDLIAAFADGEVDPARHAEALRKLSDDPQNPDRVAFQAALRQKVAGCLDCSPCPDEVRARIEAAFRAEFASAEQPSEQPVGQPVEAAAQTAGLPAVHADSPVAGSISPRKHAGIGPWVPAALAACLLVAAVGVFLSIGSGDRPVTAGQGPLPADLVASFFSEHNKCVTGAGTPMDTQAFPSTVEALPAMLAERFNKAQMPGRFDLAQVGLEYDMAGSCQLPAKGAVHVVYQDPDRRGRGGLSVWVREVDDRSPQNMEPQRAYMASDGPDRAMIFWRADGFDFFLVSDRADQAMAAAEAVGMPSKVRQASWTPEARRPDRPQSAADPRAYPASPGPTRQSQGWIARN